jgi:hypothetical protein
MSQEGQEKTEKEIEDRSGILEFIRIEKLEKFLEKQVIPF